MAYTDIDKPSDYFDTKLYTGTGSNNITLTMDNVGWVWMKNRTNTGNHILMDIVRGGNNSNSQKPVLVSNTGGAEQGSDITATGGLAFGSTSTVIGSDNGGYNYNNSTSSNYVAWHWGAGGSASNNTDGNTTTSVSVNQDAGFSIMKYAGDGNDSTIGHGLGAKPEYIIFKEIDGAESWRVWSKYTPDTASKALALNLTDAAFSQSGWIGAISTSTISIGTDSSINTNGNNYIAYAFAPKQGFSKFGSYTGNGNANGTFIYTGFKPAWVMIKNTTTAGKHWVIHDNKRNTFNPTNKELVAQGSGEEVDDTRFDFLSNGLKIRDSASYVNTSGDIYIYMCFAENPFVTSSGVPATAR